jgi:hypothetical protein
VKYLFAFLAGVVLGTAVVLFGVYLNPLARYNEGPPLDPSTEVFYRTVTDTLLRASSPDDPLASVPDTIAGLWAPTLASTEVRLLALQGEDGAASGLGVRFATLSEATRPLTGALLVNSVWNIHLNDRGSLFVDATDNLWPFARGVLLPAWRADDRRWQGRFSDALTVGPGAAGTGVATGSSGEFAGVRGEARETLAVDSLSLGDRRLQALGMLQIAAGAPAIADRRGVTP